MLMWNSFQDTWLGDKAKCCAAYWWLLPVKRPGSYRDTCLYTLRWFLEGALCDCHERVPSEEVRGWRVGLEGHLWTSNKRVPLNTYSWVLVPEFWFWSFWVKSGSRCIAEFPKWSIWCTGSWNPAWQIRTACWFFESAPPLQGVVHHYVFVELTWVVERKLRLMLRVDKSNIHS